MPNNKKLYLKSYEETYLTKSAFFNAYFNKKLKENREKIHNIFLNNVEYTDQKSLLDIGTTPSLEPHNNIILEKTSQNNNVSCLSNQDCSVLKNKFKNIKDFFIRDGKNTNLPSENYDIVYSSAVIEHVGSLEEQIKFVKECSRLSKNEVFITTPNKFFPIEFHTKIPFLHLLPNKIYRKILNFFGLGFFSLEENLNLLSKKDLVYICENLNIKNYFILEYKIWFMTSNFILIIKKNNY